jgi:hypothetical protein
MIIMKKRAVASDAATAIWQTFADNVCHIVVERLNAAALSLTPV